MNSGKYIPAEPFHLTITLQDIGFRELVLNFMNITDFLDELGGELTSVFCHQIDWRSVGRHTIVQELLRDVFSGSATES